MSIFNNYEVKTIKKIEKYICLFNSKNKMKSILGKILLNRLKKNNGCNIFPSCQFGKNIYIAHPNNITIGATAILNNNILIYPGVQLVSNPISEKIFAKEERRHPLIKDNCILCVNCIIIGNVTIGKNCIIGAGAIVTHDVPDNTIVLNVNQFQDNQYKNSKIVKRMVENHFDHMMFIDETKVSNV